RRRNAEGAAALRRGRGASVGAGRDLPGARSRGAASAPADGSRLRRAGGAARARSLRAVAAGARARGPLARSASSCRRRVAWAARPGLARGRARRSGSMTLLPDALAAWRPLLALFDRDVGSTLAPMLDRLSRAIGPLSPAATEASGDPAGYDGVA